MIARVCATALLFVVMPVLVIAEGGWPVTVEGTLLVMNKRDNSVSLFELATGERITTLPTGTEPHEGAASGRFAVIANTDYNGASGHTLTVIDVLNEDVAKTIPLGDYANPHGIMFLPDGKRVIVTAEGSDAVVIVDVEKGEVVQAISTEGHPCHMVVPTPNGKRAFATSINQGTLVALDLEQGVLIGTVVTGDGAEGFDVSPDGREVWVGNRGEDTIAIVDVASLEIKEKIESKGSPIRIKFALGGDVALVSNYRANVVSVFETSTLEEEARIAMKNDATPIGILVAPGGRYAFVANTGANLVTVIDAEEKRVVYTFPAGNTPDGMAWTTTK